MRIGAAVANSAGEITPSLSDISDITGTPADGQNLQYSAGTGLWSPVTPSGATKEYIRWGQGESVSYSTSPSNTSLNSSNPKTIVIYPYDSNPVNTIPSSTIRTRDPSGTVGSQSTYPWLYYVILPAGTYRFTATCNVDFSSTGYFQFGLFDATGNPHTPWATIGDSSEHGAIATGIRTFSGGSNRCWFYVGTSSGVASKSSQGTFMTQSTSLLIEKLS